MTSLSELSGGRLMLYLSHSCAKPCGWPALLATGKALQFGLD